MVCGGGRALERKGVRAGAAVVGHGDCCGGGCRICAVEGNGGRRNRAGCAAGQAAAGERDVASEAAQGRDGYRVGAGSSTSDGVGSGRSGDGEIGDALS